MSSSLRVVPSKDSRTELLAWLNELLPTTAANGSTLPRLHKVEQCGNGVPYAVLLPLMLPVQYPPLNTRAKVPAKHDFESAANLKLITDALQKNGIPRPDVLTDDTDKLIKGAYQANLQLLQWFRGLHDVLATQPRSPQSLQSPPQPLLPPQPQPQQRIYKPSNEREEEDGEMWNVSGLETSQRHPSIREMRATSHHTNTTNTTTTMTTTITTRPDAGMMNGATITHITAGGGKGPSVSSSAGDPAGHYHPAHTPTSGGCTSSAAALPESTRNNSARLPGSVTSSRAVRPSTGELTSSRKVNTRSPQQRSNSAQRQVSPSRVKTAASAGATPTANAARRANTTTRRATNTTTTTTGAIGQQQQQQGSRTSRSPLRVGAVSAGGSTRPATSLLRPQNGKINTTSNNNNNNNNNSSINNNPNNNNKISSSSSSSMNGGMSQREPDTTLTDRTSGSGRNGLPTNTGDHAPIIAVITSRREGPASRPVLCNSSTSSYNNNNNNNTSSHNPNTIPNDGMRKNSEEASASVCSPKIRSKGVQYSMRNATTPNSRSTCASPNIRMHGGKGGERNATSPALLTQSNPSGKRRTQSPCRVGMRSKSDAEVTVEMLTTVENERQFYYDKLRQVELLLLPIVERGSYSGDTRSLASSLLDILYATD
ncbi:microtubule-associated protein, RP/EB family [Trypanosoma theileri]|uniref:Microtubule-associated protein, RP/EB family n=1 Tax=Trypanosoma theileri TaxID=67003 RepID=A0A1X0P8H1_9TRYP|nr:microtubule-associated protein, RP/EB family [Trypanosoma theileri]ORC92879.1 microtubule-associated protein, RP/EB family [Trypanosoma theileri]